MATTTTTCTELVPRRRSIGVMAKGTDSYTTAWGRCTKAAEAGTDLCITHRRYHEKIARLLAARKARS